MFLSNGNWVPDQIGNNSTNTIQRNSTETGQSNTQLNVPQIAPQGNKLQFYPQANMQALQQNPQMMAMRGQVFGGPGYGPTPQNQAPIPNAVQASIPLHAQNMYGALPNTPPQGAQNNSAPMATVAPVNPAPFQIPQYNPSLTQSVNMSDPQARQNYLKALGSAQGAASNNAWRNPVGMHGQGPQAGFVGFQQNGQPLPAFQAAQFNGSAGQIQNANSPVTPGNVTGGGGDLGNAVAAPPSANAVNSNQIPPAAATASKRQMATPTGQFNALNYNQAASDVNSKKNIQQGQSQLQEFLDSLGVYDYEYKDPKYGEGRRISPMAQEIEQTPLGKAAISTNEEGYKVVDYGKLGGTMLASLAMLNHKNNSLEQEVEDLKKSIMTNLKNKGKK